MLRCDDCQMTFETSSTLERHRQKYCDKVATPILLGRHKIQELEEMKKKRQMLRKLQDREENALMKKLKTTSNDLFHEKDKTKFVERPDSSYRYFENLGNRKHYNGDSQRETMSQLELLNSRNSGAYSRNVLSETEMYSSDRLPTGEKQLPSRRQTGSYFNMNQLRKQGNILDEQNAKIQRKLRLIREEKEENDLSFRFLSSPSPPSPPPNGHYAVYSPRRPDKSRPLRDIKKSAIPRWRGFKHIDSDSSDAYQFTGRFDHTPTSTTSQRRYPYKTMTPAQRNYQSQRQHKEYKAPRRRYDVKPRESIPESLSSDSLDSYARDSAEENVDSSSVFNPLPRNKRESSVAVKPPLPKVKKSGYPYRQIHNNAQTNSRLSHTSQQKQIDDVIKIINDQKSRSETLLEDLKKQIDQIQTTQQRQLQAQAERISNASRGSSLTGYGTQSHVNLRKLKASNSLVDEIKFMKDDYLQSGGNDRQVLDDMDNLLKDAMDLDNDKGNSNLKDTPSLPADLRKQRWIQQMEEENRRLNEELRRLRVGAGRQPSLYETPEALPYY